MRTFIVASLALGLLACASRPPFPARAPMWKDGDLRAVEVSCRTQPSPKDQRHVTCAPEVYESPLVWDGADNLVFRPLAESFAFDPGGEAVNVNSLDEVPDSAWFSNRPPPGAKELTLGACQPSDMLDPQSAADGTWVIDKGKGNGSSPGFRVTIPGKGRYMFKAEPREQPEHPSAASVIGAAAYDAVGFNTSCEQIIYFKPSLLKLLPGLVTEANFGDAKPFDQKALDAILDAAPKRGGLVRIQASAWLPGYLVGPFRYKGTRDDDPNDVVAHEDRRELRGGRILAAWLDHFDAREQNSMDTWIADGKGAPDSSPGHVVHYYLDTSDCLGSEWAWDEISRRLGYSYIVDWGYIAADFVTLGIPTRSWDRVRKQPGQETFAYFDVQNFEPEKWRNEYPNPAFSRMTERDAAWMARILSRFTPADVESLAKMGQFSDPGRTAYLARVLEGRLERILDRYLTRLSPIAGLRVEGPDQLCGVDLAEQRGVRPAGTFRYAARTPDGAALAVSKREGATVCVTVPHIAADGGPADGALERYLTVAIDDGVARGTLIVHLYDLGPRRGFLLAGLERPEP
ncbi:MAG TPA: hypothetical protein VIF09_20405 [Polyangiaceae bacterium]